MEGSVPDQWLRWIPWKILYSGTAQWPEYQAHISRRPPQEIRSTFWLPDIWFHFFLTTAAEYPTASSARASSPYLIDSRRRFWGFFWQQFRNSRTILPKTLTWRTPCIDRAETDKCMEDTESLLSMDRNGVWGVVQRKESEQSGRGFLLRSW